MKVLVVTNFYTPQLTPRAIRWTAICEYWAAQGVDVNVVAGAVAGAPSEEVLNGVSVYRVGNRLVENIRERFLPRQPKGRAGDASGAAPIRRNKLRRSTLLKSLHDATWKRIYWPDFACLWIAPAVRKSTALLAADPDRKLVSVSLPFSGHLVGLQLRKRFPGIRWIADVGDPFALSHRTPHNNHRLYSNRNYQAERNVLGQAHAVAVTAEGALRAYKAAFPELAPKLHVIPPVIALPQTGAPSQNGQSSNGARRLTYVGQLYRSIRTPDYLLRLFARLLETPTMRDLELHFYGDTSECAPSFEAYQDLLNQKIFIHGMKSRADVSAAMRESDLLINIGNDTEYQLPSKVVEYASTGRPILNIVKSARDSSREFLTAYPQVLHLYDVPGAINTADVQAIQQLLSDNHEQHAQLTAKWLEPFTVARVAEQYDALLNHE